MTDNYNIKIIGAGPSSSILAICLAKYNNNIDIFDTLSIDKLIGSDRTYALTQSSRKVFELAGVWDSIERSCYSFDSLVVHDKVISRSIISIGNISNSS